MNTREKILTLFTILVSITSLVLLGILIGATNFKNKGGNYTWFEVIGGVGSLFGGLATCITAYVAYLALTTWKSEHHWKRQDSVERGLSEAWGEYDLAVSRLAMSQLLRSKEWLLSKDPDKKLNDEVDDNNQIELKFEDLVLRARKFDFEFETDKAELKALFISFEMYKMLDAVELPLHAIIGKQFDVENYVKNGEEAIKDYLLESKLAYKQVLGLKKHNKAFKTDS